MEVGIVRKVDIDAEMQQAYLDYAMSVIVARALPDARDGLKPVHRRILYAMYDMGLRPDTPYKKSARIVGEVLGKYHPHGDLTIYEAMARMAQDFSMRAMLVDGQGNFGSVDGDPPAAMRYTEARLTPLAAYMLADIQKNTVNFSDNFDSTLQEPDLLPAAIPNLLVNGATGIAVGMATSIPPHNLNEVVDALIYMLQNWDKLDDIAIEDLMRFIKGPDFPTGGVIIQNPVNSTPNTSNQALGNQVLGIQPGDTLASAYATGRGRVTVQAHAHLEEMVRGRNRIIVSELPYMTNKAALIERIADLVRGGKLEGIADLRDESDRQGMRIVIELTKAAEPQAVLRDLYKNTPMRDTFSIIMLALVDGEPRMLSLKQALRVYLEHRLTVVRRRSEYELERARQRAHILEGLRIALQNLDEVINLIRKSPDAETARKRLMKQFKLSDLQAQAILDMPLRRLAALERKKIEEEYKEAQVQIKALEVLLNSPKKMRLVVSDDLLLVKKTFGDPRRTHIIQMDENQQVGSFLTTTDLVPDHFVWVMATSGSDTNTGLISRTVADQLPDINGLNLKLMMRANTRDTLYLVAENGEAAAIPMHTLPQVASPLDGTPITTLTPLLEGHQLAAIIPLPPKDERPEGWFVLSITRQGMVKKTSLTELPGPTAQPFVLVKVNSGDRLGWVRLTDGQAAVFLGTFRGMVIRFLESDIRPMGLVAAGVMGIKLREMDEVVAAEIIPILKTPRQAQGEVLLIASDGSGKRVSTAQFPTQGRYGQGVTAWTLPSGVRMIGMVVGGEATQVLLQIARQPSRMIMMGDSVHQGRSARGKSLLQLKSGTYVEGLTVPWDPLRVKTDNEVAKSGKSLPRGTKGVPRVKKGLPRDTKGK